MSADGDLDYALARIAARRSQRAGATGWRALEALRGYGAALAAARGAGFEPWVEALDARAGADTIEATLRDAWRREVARLAGWMPRAWRPALDTCAAWVDLPQRRAAAPDADLDWRIRLAAQLEAAGAGGDPAFDRLGRLLDAHRARFAGWPPGNGWPLREELERQLLGFMHAAAPGAATAFAWVGVLALDHERLRGILLSRAAREAAA